MGQTDFFENLLLHTRREFKKTKSQRFAKIACLIFLGDTRLKGILKIGKPTGGLGTRGGSLDIFMVKCENKLYIFCKSLRRNYESPSTTSKINYFSYPAILS